MGVLEREQAFGSNLSPGCLSAFKRKMGSHLSGLQFRSYSKARLLSALPAARAEVANPALALPLPG